MTNIGNAFRSALSMMQPRGGGRIGAAEAEAKIAAGEAILLDVRELAEIRGGLAEPATWVPTSDIGRGGPAWQDFLAAASKEKLVVVYCAAGIRAGQVCQLLEAQGYRTANLGGFRDWAVAGLPVRIPKL